MIDGRVRYGNRLGKFFFFPLILWVFGFIIIYQFANILPLSVQVLVYNMF